MTQHCGIPTVGPRGTCYRSLDAFGWAWEYEPIDLAGYIPDFIVRGGSANRDGAPVLVEVKPEMVYSNLATHVEKNQTIWVERRVSHCRRNTFRRE